MRDALAFPPELDQNEVNSCGDDDMHLSDTARAVDGDFSRGSVLYRRSGSTDSANSFIEGSPEVWLHIYHTDPYTGFLNKALLKSAQIPIYHAGVEVYGEEWSFQYFEDTWNDPSISGVLRCQPKLMAGYDYQESISLGTTPYQEDAVDHIIARLQMEWPACSYHLTRRNCLTFAETFASVLMAPEPFPAWLRGILDASNNNGPVVDDQEAPERGPVEQSPRRPAQEQ
jgi:hypothetical protein